MSDSDWYCVHYGESCQRVAAKSPGEAFEIVRNLHESEWGDGAFDQYDVQIELEYAQDKV
jgi:hypothetical protein